MQVAVVSLPRKHVQCSTLSMNSVTKTDTWILQTLWPIMAYSVCMVL